MWQGTMFKGEEENNDISDISRGEQASKDLWYIYECAFARRECLNNKTISLKLIMDLK